MRSVGVHGGADDHCGPVYDGTKRQARERAAYTGPAVLHDNRLGKSNEGVIICPLLSLLKVGGKLQLLFCVSEAPAGPDRGQHPCATVPAASRASKPYMEDFSSDG
ncbi:hypothetical protein NEUTE1DRAFT_101907 [Neurospora tetrasperma FGSC 2508]|uniref:Uncharacterized protein n=1 Tax=Neurospora tetrasperma (strain FGSC 2508 / ATCC MYA-4615 / P0657) TaxID=510951 RepID=F8MQK6_NEUT8|nr:uncharacterized protein NEUTE1DRAFT_101907 [Neurospora tetrasperma FGSC 2508]EGO56636.1 hypothetical protein NEUTE1DRAFT_101907 [Neurospora tetrasperma FGSC 2508]